MIKTDTAYNTVVGMMPDRIAEKMRALDAAAAAGAAEIRLRAGRPCTVFADGRSWFIPGVNGQPLNFSQNEIKALLAHMCGYALYQKEDELKQGFVTIRGGHRIGVCATWLQNGVIDISSVGSIAIRIARQHRGCAAGVFGRTMTDGLRSVLLAGPPLSGKTTVLRDLCRILASRPVLKKIAVIDERGELAGVYHGQPALDVGACSDVLDGHPRAMGFEIAVRTLSPDLIACDELGAPGDFEALMEAGRSGVKLLASVHAGSLDELQSRGQAARCLDSGVFDYVVFLEGMPHIGRVKSIHKVVGSCG